MDGASLPRGSINQSPVPAPPRRETVDNNDAEAARDADKNNEVLAVRAQALDAMKDVLESNGIEANVTTAMPRYLLNAMHRDTLDLSKIPTATAEAAKPVLSELLKELDGVYPIGSVNLGDGFNSDTWGQALIDVDTIRTLFVPPVAREQLKNLPVLVNRCHLIMTGDVPEQVVQEAAAAKHHTETVASLVEALTSGGIQPELKINLARNLLASTIDGTLDLRTLGALDADTKALLLASLPEIAIQLKTFQGLQQIVGSADDLAALGQHKQKFVDAEIQISVHEPQPPVADAVAPQDPQVDDEPAVWNQWKGRGRAARVQDPSPDRQAPANESPVRASRVSNVFPRPGAAPQGLPASARTQTEPLSADIDRALQSADEKALSFHVNAALARKPELAVKHLTLNGASISAWIGKDSEKDKAVGRYVQLIASSPSLDAAQKIDILVSLREAFLESIKAKTPLAARIMLGVLQSTACAKDMRAMFAFMGVELKDLLAAVPAQSRELREAIEAKHARLCHIENLSKRANKVKLCNFPAPGVCTPMYAEAHALRVHADIPANDEGWVVISTGPNDNQVIDALPYKSPLGEAWEPRLHGHYYELAAANLEVYGTR